MSFLPPQSSRITLIICRSGVWHLQPIWADVWKAYCWVTVSVWALNYSWQVTRALCWLEYTRVLLALFNILVQIYCCSCSYWEVPKLDEVLPTAVIYNPKKCIVSRDAINCHQSVTVNHWNLSTFCYLKTIYTHIYISFHSPSMTECST